MKKMNQILMLAMAVALTGCADVVKLADPAYTPTTVQECLAREAVLQRANLAGVVTGTFSAAWDLATAPVAAASHALGITKSAYAGATATRNHVCDQILSEHRQANPPPGSDSQPE